MLALQSLEKGATLVLVLVPVLALGVPVSDLVLTVLRRTVASGAGSVFRADRDHIHHRLLGRGLTHRGAVVTLYIVCAALGALAFTAVLVQDPANAVIVGLAA